MIFEPVFQFTNDLNPDGSARSSGQAVWEYIEYEHGIQVRKVIGVSCQDYKEAAALEEFVHSVYQIGVKIGTKKAINCISNAIDELKE
jgi:hypothetical protein